MKGTALRFPGALALLAAALAALAPPARAQASPFVPVWDAAYRDLDVLLATGMVSRETAGHEDGVPVDAGHALAAERQALDA